MEKDLQRIKESLQGANLALVSKVTTVHTNTLYKIQRGSTGISAGTISKLKAYFEID